MAIQFTCVSCEKAIEVADEWSCRLVECPYCGDTVTAPGISQPPPKPADQVVTPIASIEGSTPQQTFQPAANTYEASDFKLVQRRKRFDGLALTGLIFCFASMALYAASVGLFVIEVFERAGPNASPDQLQEFAKQASENPPAWANKMMLVGGLAFGVWLIGAIISIAAYIRNRRNPRGKLANWALLLNTYVPILMLLGFVFGQF